MNNLISKEEKVVKAVGLGGGGGGNIWILFLQSMSFLSSG
jgi:hypothetical protein